MSTALWNVPLVRAFRGPTCGVTDADEEALEEIWQFFQRLSKPDLQAAQEFEKGDLRPASTRSNRYWLPRKTPDWYVVRGVKRLCWPAQGDENERLYEHIARLHRMGIPTFLQESLSKSLMKLFVSLEAYVREERLPPEGPARTEYWTSLKQTLAEFVLQELAQVVACTFQPPNRDNDNLVAVFDASGWSAAAGRWKLSSRICFVEIAVAQDTARRVRENLVLRLEEAWLPERRPQGLQELALAVEPIAHPPFDAQGAAASTQGAAASTDEANRSLWDSIVDDRPLQANAQHRMVWCDTVHRDLGLPEGRVLKPEMLLKVTAQPGTGPPILKHGERLVDKVSDADWVRHGAIHTRVTHPTDFVCAARGHLPQEKVAPQTLAAAVEAQRAAVASNEGQASMANIGTASSHPENAAHQWIEYVPETGPRYYYSFATRETRWQLPEGVTAVRQQTSYSQHPQQAQQQPQQQQQQQTPQAPRAGGEAQAHLWTKHADPSTGRNYFYNHTTNHTTWTLPPGVVVS